MTDGGMPPDGAGEQAGSASRDGGAGSGPAASGPTGSGAAASAAAASGPTDSAAADSGPTGSGPAAIAAAASGPADSGAADSGAADSGAADSRLAGSGPVRAETAAGGRAELLLYVKSLRRRARSARHGYWFPLVLFGLLTCASIPFYRQSFSSPGNGIIAFAASTPRLPAFGGMPGLVQNGLAFYWLGALLAGLVLTLLWYRWHARRVGLRTPSRGFVVTIVAVTVLAVVLPALTVASSPHWLRFMHRLGPLWPGDLLARGTFPLLIIAAGLLVLAWAERSLSLTVIASVYTGTALLASLYDIGNLTYRLGWTPPPSIYALPNLLLPALVLLAAGAGALVAQHRHDAAMRSSQ